MAAACWTIRLTEAASTTLLSTVVPLTSSSRMISKRMASPFVSRSIVAALVCAACTVAPRPAGATVTLRVRRDPGGITLTAEIADDGPGFTPGARPSGNGVGLESVRERLRLGGAGHAFALESAPGAGTRVRVTLPLSPAPPSRLETARVDMAGYAPALPARNRA